MAPSEALGVLGVCWLNCGYVVDRGSQVSGVVREWLDRFEVQVSQEDAGDVTSRNESRNVGKGRGACGGPGFCGEPVEETAVTIGSSLPGGTDTDDCVCTDGRVSGCLELALAPLSV